MWTWIITFLKNFSWISGAWKTVKGVFTPFNILILALFLVTVGGNYFFYKQLDRKKQTLNEYQKIVDDLNKSNIKMKEQYLIEIKSKEMVQAHYKRVLKVLQNSSKAKIQRSKEYAKDMEKIKKFKALPLGADVAAAYRRMYDKDHSAREDNISR